eukprot:Opistho-2@7481
MQYDGIRVHVTVDSRTRTRKHLRGNVCGCLRPVPLCVDGPHELPSKLVGTCPATKHGGDKLGILLDSRAVVTGRFVWLRGHRHRTRVRIGRRCVHFDRDAGPAIHSLLCRIGTHKRCIRRHRLDGVFRESGVLACFGYGRGGGGKDFHWKGRICREECVGGGNRCRLANFFHAKIRDACAHVRPEKDLRRAKVAVEHGRKEAVHKCQCIRNVTYNLPSGCPSERRPTFFRGGGGAVKHPRKTSIARKLGYDARALWLNAHAQHACNMGVLEAIEQRAIATQFAYGILGKSNASESLYGNLFSTNQSNPHFARWTFAKALKALNVVEADVQCG